MAVSVRTPPKLPRWTERAFLEEMREEAGRERREKERANTMLNDNKWNEVLKLVVELQLAIEWRDNAGSNWDFCRGGRAEIKCGIDVKNLGIGKYHSRQLLYTASK